MCFIKYEQIKCCTCFIVRKIFDSLKIGFIARVLFTSVFLRLFRKFVVRFHKRKETRQSVLEVHLSLKNKLLVLSSL